MLWIIMCLRNNKHSNYLPEYERQKIPLKKEKKKNREKKEYFCIDSLTDPSSQFLKLNSKAVTFWSMQK